MEKLVWVAKNYFLIIGVAASLLIPFSLELLLLLHRYSFLISFALWLCKKKEVAGRNAAAVVPKAAPAPMASSVANLFNFLFFKPQEEEQWLRGFEVDEPSTASQGPAWWLSQPVLAPAGAVGKEAAEEFVWDGVLVDSTAWKRADVAPSAPPISTAYSTSFFPFNDCKAEGGWEHNKSMEETWEEICLMKEEKGERRMRVKDAGGRWKMKLFRGMDALIEKQLAPAFRVRLPARGIAGATAAPRRGIEPAASSSLGHNTNAPRRRRIGPAPVASLTVTQTISGFVEVKI